MRGEAVVSPEMTGKLVTAFQPRRPPPRRPAPAPDPLAQLSAREQQVLEQIALGASNKEIARALVDRRDHGEDPRAAHPAQAGSHVARAGGGVRRRRLPAIRAPAPRTIPSTARRRLKPDQDGSEARFRRPPIGPSAAKLHSRPFGIAGRERPVNSSKERWHGAKTSSFCMGARCTTEGCSAGPAAATVEAVKKESTEPSMMHRKHHRPCDRPRRDPRNPGRCWPSAPWPSPSASWCG